MLHMEAVVYSKEWTMPASVQSYVGSKGATGGCRKATFMQRHRMKVAFLRTRVPVEQSGER
jgi:hypothetical protein